MKDEFVMKFNIAMLKERKNINNKNDFLPIVINILKKTIHNFNSKWWHDLDSGEPIKITNDIILSKIALIHSELSEAVEGVRKGLMDDHLPNRSMIEVELADSIIRTFDLAEALNLDLGGAIAEKCQYNITRADHSVEHRKSASGKKV